VDDLIDGFVPPDGDAGHVTGPVNLGNPGEFTDRGARARDHRHDGSRSEIVHSSRCRRTTRSSAGRTSPLAAEALGWRPTIDLRSGLARTVAYFEALLRTDRARAVALRSA
jgi:UDP-glucuronate decarboxylase